MTDREMLEAAAKAAGIKVRIYSDLIVERGTDCVVVNEYGFKWNPLTDDGDALRLAVKVLNWPHGGRAFDNAVTAMSCVNKLPKDPYAATRRAIVRAAAEIGRAMP